MLRLLIWLIVCLLLCVAFRRSPTRLIAIAVGFRLAFPSVAGSVILGPNPPVHPATVFLAAATLVLLLRDGQSMLSEIGRSFGLHLLLAFLAAQALLVTGFLAPDSLSALVNTYISGLTLFFLVRAYTFGTPDATRKIMRFLVTVAAAEAIFAIVQVSTGSAILFVGERASFYWERGGPLVRAVGTLDSPIDLAMLCVIAIPMTVVFRNSLTRFAMPLLLLGGALASQSRVGTIMGAIALLYPILRARTTGGKKFLALIALPLAAWCIALLNRPLVDGFLYRLATDTNSGIARGRSLDVFLGEVWGREWHGGGFRSSYEIRSLGLSEASLENGFFMYAWDFGLLFAALLVASLAGVLMVGAARGAVRGTVVAGVIAMVMAASFSGIATQSAASWLLFLAVGLAAPHAAPAPRATVSMSAQRRANART